MNATTKHALLINANSPLGLEVFQRICRLGYTVTALLVDATDANYFRHIEYTNPEFRGCYRLVELEPDSVADANRVISNSKIEAASPLDLVVSLNGTEQTCQKWDIELVYQLFKKGLISPNDSSVIIGRNAPKSLDTTNTALEASVASLGKLLGEAGIGFHDFTQVSSLPGDEAYMADTYTNELLRTQFKVSKVASVLDLANWLIYYFAPAFLLHTCVYIKCILQAYLNLDKEKTD